MANEKLILHGDANHTDTSGKGHEASVTATVDTGTKKFGDGSFSFDGTQKIIFPDSTDWDVFASSTENWTIDFWIKQTTADLATNTKIIEHHQDDNYWMFYRHSGGDCSWTLVTSGTSVLAVSSANSWADTDWHHVCLCKVATEYGVYVDGTQTAFLSSSTTADWTGQLNIGRFEEGDTEYIIGNIDEFRISNDNVYNLSPVTGDSDTFTKPTAAVPDQITNVIATKSSTASTVDLAWDTPNTSYATALCVERRIANGAWAVLSSTESATAASYTDSTATQSALYSYRVRRYTSTYTNYTDYTNSNTVDMTATAKMVGFVGKHLVGLSTNDAGGEWQPIQTYSDGSVQTTVSGSLCTIAGTTTLFSTYSNVEVNDVVFLPTVSGTSGTISYSSPYPVTVVSGATTLVISGCSLTLASATNYAIAKTLVQNEPLDFLTYDLHLFMAKESNTPLRYDASSTAPMGCAPPTTACTGTGDTGGSLDDGAVYNYNVTFVYGDYGESNGGTAFELDLDPGDTESNLTAIPTGGQYVTARNVYRTEGGGSDYYYVAQIADNTTTTYTDQISDAAIVATGVSLPAINDVPEQFGCIGEKYTRLFGGKNVTYPFRLYYTAAGKPYAWDAAYYVDRDGKGKIMKIVDAFDALLIFFERGIEMADVSNATPSNWAFVTIPTSVGLASTQALVHTNQGIYLLGINNGVPEVHMVHRGEQSVVNATFDNIVPDSLSERIDTFMQNINMEYIHLCRLSVFNNKLYLSVPYGTSTICNRTAIYDIRRDAWSIKLSGYTTYTITGNKLLAGSPDDDYAHQIENDYTDSSGSNVSMTLKTGQLNADRPDLMKSFELLRVRANASSGTITITWSCDYGKTTGTFSYNLATEGKEFVRYFPDSATGRVIQLTFECTNSVATKIIDIELNFQIYELGS